MPETCNLAKILLVEDSKNEFLLTQMLLRRENIVLDIDLSRSNDEAIKYLSTKKADIIVIDKRIALQEDNKLITFIQNSSNLKKIPVVMLFGISNETSDITPYSCELGVNLCLDKPLNYDKISFLTKQVDFLSFQRSGNQIYLCSNL
jgi:response regulator RpfG family c-di-GMP phosphodiesterase